MYYQLNDVLQSTACHMQGQKCINSSQLKSVVTVFLSVFWCMYSLRNTVVNADARSYE